MTNSPFLAASVAPAEVAHFSDCAGEWWSKRGIFGVLHDLLPLRLRYVMYQCAAFGAQKKESKKTFQDLCILDMGCGGGLMSEALAAKGARITGVDASSQVIDVAQKHAKESGLDINYRVSTAEALAQEKKRFDVIVALEIVEHVADLESFMRALSGLLKPEGLLIVSTLNRTTRSFLLGTVMAEYVLGWVPVGTHDWDKFVRPSEMAALCEKNNMIPVDVMGLVYRPLRRCFELCRGKTKVNYFMTAKKRKKG